MNKQFNGVSPVIGVILMVALVVGLAALVSVIGFNIGDEPSESPDATVKLDSTGDSVEVSVLRNENVDEIYVTKDGNRVDVDSSVGTNKNIKRGSGNYKVIAVTSDGSEQVIKQKEFSNVNNVGTLSGSVKINPDIPGATVEALDSSGSVVGTTTTDQDGSYSFDQQSVDRVRVIANNIKPSDLSDPSVISNPLYATAIKQNKTGRVSFDFGSTSNVKCTATINGNDRTIVLNRAEDGKLQIGNVFQLQAIDDCRLDEDYKLISDIDASATSSWNSGAGFEPIGDGSTPFTGTLDGQGYTIDGLYINRPGTVNVGLIGKNNGLIENIVFTGSDVTGDNYVGTVVGNNEDGSVRNVDNNNGLLIGSDNPSTPHSNAPDCSTITYEESGTSSDPYKISNDHELQCMSKDTSGNYIITRNIDATKTDQWNGGSGFDSVGGDFSYGDKGFTGTLNGQDHKISGLYVGLIGGEDDDSYDNGLIGFAGDTELKNMELVNFDIKGYYVSGTLVGSLNNGTVSNVHAISGELTTEDSAGSVGGLVGDFGSAVTPDECPVNGLIKDSSADAFVTSTQEGGGLVGRAGDNCDIRNSYSTGSLTRDIHTTGGLVGSSTNNEIKNSYSTSDVSTGSETADCFVDNSGGFAGDINGVTIQNSYSTGNVGGCDGDDRFDYVGGFVGAMSRDSTVENVYSTGKVTTSKGTSSDGLIYAGGIVGSLGYSSGDNEVLKDSYYDSQTTQQSSTVGYLNTDYGEKQGEVTGLTTSEMQGDSAKTNMGSFDFANTWNTVSGDYPELSWQP